MRRFPPFASGGTEPAKLCTAAKSLQQRRPLFQQKICHFSKQQRAIWRLFNHIVGANDHLRSQICSKKNLHALMRGRIFFQALISELQPKSPLLVDICKDILRHDILKKSIARRLSEENLEQIVKCVSQAEDLAEVMASLQLPTTRCNQEGDVYSAFMRTGKLTIHSAEECYDYYKQSLIGGNQNLIAWFEAYLARHLDVFIQPAYRAPILNELSALGANGLKNNLISIYVSRLFLPLTHLNLKRKCIFLKSTL